MGSDMFLYRLTVSFLTIQIYFSFDNNCKIFVYTICIYEMLDVESRPCLLYTSPSPRDRQKSRMPSSA